MKDGLKFWETATDSLVKHLKTLHWYKKEMVKEIKDKLAQGDTLLDVGCGPGAFIKPLSDIVGNNNLTNLDYCDKMIEEARKDHPRAIFIKGDIRKLAYKNNSFDACLCNAILQAMPFDYKKAISELVRVSRKYIFFAEFIAPEGKPTHGRMPNKDNPDVGKLYWMAFGEEEFRGILSSLGLEIITFKRTQRTFEKNGLGEGDTTIITCKKN